MDKSSEPGDLAELASKAGLNTTAYKTFSNSRLKMMPPKQEESQTKLAIVKDGTPKNDSAALPRLQEELQMLTKLYEELPQLRSSPKAVPPSSKKLMHLSRWERWAALDSVLNGHEWATGAKNAGPEQSLPGCALVGSCAGAGTTSIVASLARLGAKRGERVLLLDDSTESFLSLFFGSRASRIPIASYINSNDPKGAAVHACRREETVLAISSEAWISSCLNQLSLESDRVMLDAGAGNHLSLSDSRIGGVTRVLVLAPDTRSLYGLKRFDNSMQQQSDQTLILLNQFDHSDPLHVEIQARLENRFPHRLIPIVIRRDRMVSAALAEGSTVVDYAPESDATEDLAKLDQWLRSYCLEMSSGEFTQKAQVL